MGSQALAVPCRDDRAGGFVGPILPCPLLDAPLLAEDAVERIVDRDLVARVVEANLGHGPKPPASAEVRYKRSAKLLASRSEVKERMATIGDNDVCGR